MFCYYSPSSPTSLLHHQVFFNLFLYFLIPIPMDPFPWRCFFEETMNFSNKHTDNPSNPNLTYDGCFTAQNPPISSCHEPIHSQINNISADLTKKPTTVNQSKSFAQAVSNICDVPTSQLPKPVLKGNIFAISIPEEEYDIGMETCKHNLHARILWPKGSTPLTVYALRNKLSVLWKDLNRWGVSSLGKGYYEFCFSTLEDLKRVRSFASWNLNPGVLKFFSWSKDFCPRSQTSTTAQVWVRIYSLPQEYWRPKILFAIANSVGTPICTDPASTKPMMERTFGQYARVLVDLDVTQELRYQVLVERKGYAFFVDLDFENIPDFCTNCRKIGHHINVCKSLHRYETVKEGVAPNKADKIQKKVFVQVQDGSKKQGNKETEPIDVDDGKIDDGMKLMGTQVNNVQQTDKASASKLVQQNRFEVLFNEEDINIRTDMIEHDVELENEASKEVVRSNSRAQVTEETETDSEFVDNSLDAVHKTIISPVQSESENDGRDLAALERKNNEFLDRSWANVAEDEEAEKHLDALDGNTSVQPDDDFQVVKSKKASIRKEPSLVSCYKTRASDTVTDLDCHQDHGLNPNIAHDLKILRPYLKGNDACASVPRVYTDEEEREAAINYLKNRSVAEEEPFIEVSNTKKKNVQKRYQVHITSARGRRYK